MGTVLFEARNLAFSYPDSTEQVFSGASLRLYAGDKTALMGDNGSGKTTLLRLLAGDLQPDAGAITRPAGVYLLKQEDTANGGLSALDWLAGDWDQGPQVIAQAAALGFNPKELDRPVESFSGGERKMLALMAGFLRRPPLYLLDEPTNYLDGTAMARLASAIKSYRGACLVVSHDRAFLDGCVDKVLELERKTLRAYSGNYSSYAAQKSAAFALAEKKKEKLEREITNLRQMERNYRDWGAAKEKEKKGAADKGFIGARAARLQKRSARAAERARQKIDELQKAKPFIEKIRHPSLPASQNVFLQVEGLSKQAGGKTLFRDLSFNLKAGGRLCIQGGNGTGKTTLLRTIANELSPDSGRIRYSKSARIFYMPQFWQPEPGILKGADYFPGESLQAGCTMLDQLGAKGELLFSPLDSLSEGQRRKVTLARFLVHGADIALLDEPTTHQDLRSITALESALATYQGILLLITHDSEFKSALNSESITLGGGGFPSFA